MEAIEIYQKILDLVKDEDFNDVCTALNFVREKLQTTHYAKEEKLRLLGAMTGQAAAKSSYGLGGANAALEMETIADKIGFIIDKAVAMHDAKKTGGDPT